MTLRNLARTLLVFSGLIPVLGFVTSHDATLLIYTLFVVALLNRQGLARTFERIQLPINLKFFCALLIRGWLTEFFAWLGSYLKHDRTPALFHPQLIPDLILAIAFYGGWAIVWLLVLRRWRFTLGQVFFTTAFLGIFVEQNGAVQAAIIASLGNPLLAIILVLYICAVYGSIMGLPFLQRKGVKPLALKQGRAALSSADDTESCP